MTRPKADPVRRRTAAQAAEALGMTSQAIGLWAKRPGAPVEAQGGKRWYLWPAFPRWRDEELARQARASAKPENMADAELKLMESKAGLAALELAQEEGRLVPLDEVEKVWGEDMSQARSILLGFPLRHGHEFVGVKTIGEATARLTDATHDLMQHLADGVTFRVDEDRVLQMDKPRREEEKAA